MSGAGHPDLPTFFNAIEGGHESTVSLLLTDEQVRIPVNAPDVYGKSPFLLAAACGRVSIMRMLIAAGGDIHASDNYKANAVTLAAEGNHAEALRMLLELGVDANKLDVFGEAAIHRASKKGHAAAVRALIQAGGVDPDLESRSGKTPKEYAEQGKFLDLQQLIKTALSAKKKAAKALRKQQEEEAEAAAAAAAAGGASETSAAAAASSSAASDSLSSSSREASPLSVQSQAPASVSSQPAAVAEAAADHSGTATSVSAPKLKLAAAAAASSPAVVSPAYAAALASMNQASSSHGTPNSGNNSSTNNNNNNNTPNARVKNSSGGDHPSSVDGRAAAASSGAAGIGAPSAAFATNSSPEVEAQVQALLARVRQHFPSYMVIDYQDVQLCSRLGGGGGGNVYKALIKSSDRPCAAKLFRDADAALEQAVGECKTAMILHHKNIINTLGVSVFPVAWPLPSAEVMMLMDLGTTTLQSLLGEHTDDSDPESEKFASYFTWERVIRAMWQIASGLEYLHSHKPNAILHCDIKPANVICTDESPLDGLSSLKLCDFGLTRKNKDSEHTAHIDVTTIGLATIRWASPEQLFTARFGPEADCYSAGAILFWLCSGQMPWRAAEKKANLCFDIKDALRQKMNLRDTFQPRRGCPRFLVDLTLACLDPDPAKRPANGAVLLELLRQGAVQLACSGESTLMLGSSQTLDMTYMSTALSCEGSSGAGAAGGDANHRAAEATEHFCGVEPSVVF